MIDRRAVVVNASLPVLRAVILRLLRCDRTVEVVDAAGDLDEALALVAALHPSLAVIDRDLPGRDVLEELSLVSEQSPQTGVVLMASRLSDADMARAVRARVRGYALKSETVEELGRILHGALAGRTVLSSGLRNLYLVHAHAQSQVAGPPSRLEELTRREIDVLSCVARGLSVKETAAALNIRPKTVEGHKANLMAKLDIHDRVLLARHAARMGLASDWGSRGNR